MVKSPTSAGGMSKQKDRASALGTDFVDLNKPFLKQALIWLTLSTFPLASAQSSKQAPVFSWHEYSYADDGFAVSAPSRPVVKKQTAGAQAGNVETHNYYFNQSPDAGFMATVTDLGRQDIDPKTALRNAELKTVQVVEGKIVKEQPVAVGNTPGIQFEFVSKAYHSRVRYFFVKGKLVGVMSIVPP